jgi:transposase, IS5 family
MGDQPTFASIAWHQGGKRTHREQFLAEMDAVIARARLLALIESHYPKAGRGRQRLGLEKMLRIHFLQQWFKLSDPQIEDTPLPSRLTPPRRPWSEGHGGGIAMADVPESMRRFARVELGDDGVPDEPTILRFRRVWRSLCLTTSPRRLSNNPRRFQWAIP